MLLLFIVVPTLITAEKRLEQLYFTQGPEILKIHTNDDKGAADPVAVTIENIETGQVYRDTTKNGIAEFNLKEVGIEEHATPLAILAPNPISDYAELRLDPSTQLEQVRIFNTIGQEISLSFSSPLKNSSHE